MATANTDFSRQLLETQFDVYSKIVNRKHGTAFSVDLAEMKSWSNAQLEAYVIALRDMAHLPPA